MINCFSTNSNLKRHSSTCKGFIKSNECKFCNKLFSNASNKCRHQSNCKSNNNIDNSVTNHITNNVLINNFNDENIEYMSKENKAKLILKCMQFI